MKTKHTKGEWELRHTLLIYSKTGIVIASVDPIFGQASDPEMVANAKLIAAAPEMLAALLHLKNMINEDLIPESVTIKINNAIKKSTE